MGNQDSVLEKRIVDKNGRMAGKGEEIEMVAEQVARLLLDCYRHGQKTAKQQSSNKRYSK